MVAPRFTACSYSSNTRMPAPSAMVKPLRRASNGVQASSKVLALVSALLLAKPPMARGCIAASEPPVMMASACPYLIARNASPTEWVPVAQAVTIGRQGPCALWRIAMLPAAMLAIIVGIKRGEILRAPSLRSFSVSRAKVLMPPMPEPTYTPKRSGSIFSPLTKPLLVTAWLAAATAYWQ